ncbi:MAG: hypothetical protein QGI09_03200 [Dehalococcoidia bacterium]|jgi:hypothetical protein|nr:hypothetical protein [Dehalococcoidia bacterium]|tara:strand:- start:2200 stop:2373 length:174 start_codon:yes stop_codon:yes gene_type:complete
MDDLDIAVEQYLYWQRHGMTYREMIVAIAGEWYSGMSGDDVVVALTRAWQGLDRNSE